MAGDMNKFGYYVGKLVVGLSADLAMTVLGAKAAQTLGEAVKVGSAATTTTEELSVVARGATSCLKSFGAATEVLMANGRTKPIAQVRAGDRVRAADPVTGRVGVRRVTHVWVHGDELVRARLGRARVTTTADHRFWNATDKRFEELGRFDRGDRVSTAVGGSVVYRGLVARSVSYGVAYNLTVAGLHTYYVGRSRILVHNCGESDVNSATLSDDMVVVRGGQSELPKPGVEEAGAFVPHGSLRATTAGQIRAGGGSVEVAPEMTRGGNLNENHVNICIGPSGCGFGSVMPNPVPNSGRLK
jgi:hypothetical protein